MSNKHETKDSAVDMAKDIQDGKAPTNQQINKALEKAEKAIDKEVHQPNVANTEAAKTLSDFKGVLEATQQIVENKNSDGTLQKVVMEGASATKDLKEHASKEAHSGSGDKSGKAQQGKQVGQAVFSTVRLMLRNQEFRTYVKDIVTILQQMFLNNPHVTSSGGTKEAVKETVKHVAKAATASSDPKHHSSTDNKHGAHSSTDTKHDAHSSTDTKHVHSSTDTKHAALSSTDTAAEGKWQSKLTEEQKHELSFKFLALLRQMKGNKEFKDGIETIMTMFDELKSQAKRAKEQAKSSDTTHAENAFSETRKLIEEFSNHSLEHMIEAYRDLASTVNENEKLKKFVADIRSIIREAAEKPEQLDEYEFSQRIEKAIDNGREILQDEKLRKKYFEVIKEARLIFENIRNDKDVKNLQEKTKAFTDHFTYTDEKGEKHVNTDLVTQMRQFIIPLFVAQLDEIHVPTIEGSNEDYDYRIDNLVFSGKDIIPDKVEFDTKSHLEVDVKHLNTEQATTRAYLRISDINPKMKNIEYYFHKKTFPKLEDKGVANVVVGGEGITIAVELEVHKKDNVPSIKVAQVHVDIDRLKIDILETKHEFMATIFKPIYKNRIKAVIKEAIENRIRSVFDKIETGFNGLMTKFPPTSVPGILKDQIKQVTGNVNK